MKAQIQVPRGWRTVKRGKVHKKDRLLNAWPAKSTWDLADQSDIGEKVEDYKHVIRRKKVKKS